MDIKTIIEGCKNNDRKSQERLYKEYFPSMIYMCMRYIHDKDRAAEIVNDGFLKVFKKIGQFEFRGSLEGWIRRIVFHSMSDNIKKNANYLKFMVFEEYDKRTGNEVMNKLYEEDILKLIDHIPPASGDVFVLFAVQGYSHKEIAEMRGISVGTSKWHLSEARKKLQSLIINNYSNQSHAG
ncbi:MAG: RNA polymerase sigma factor [Saprospiraceae bacterium]|nr:RNA polymerase sigma factor [Bacteroidia bacterium]NNF22371.1 RNA polymerase sigma factor [Saprospiraceae bacterium]NNK89406.1 RNA polymerase sigma factor [Saprospiraceae bacterium]